MIDERITELINRAIDADLSAAERVELDALLASDHEVRAHYEEHLRLAALISKVKSLEPAESLKNAVLSTLRRREAQRQPSGAVTSIRSFLSIRNAFVFAGGVAAGLAIFALVGHQPANLSSDWDSTGAIGTIFLDGNARNATPLDRQTIHVDGQVTELTTRRTAELTFVEIDLKGTSPRTATINHSPLELELIGVSGIAGIGQANIEAGSIELPQLAPGRVVCAFRRLTAGSLFLEVGIETNETFEMTKLRAE